MTGGVEAAAVLPVPRGGGCLEAHQRTGAVVPCHLPAVDPRGQRGGRPPHGAGDEHQEHSEGALGAQLLRLQVSHFCLLHWMAFLASPAAHY